MKITHIETYPVRVPLKPERRMISSLGKHEVSEYLLVRVLTDDGLEGVGEATVMPRWSGETVWGAKALIERVFTPRLLHCDPTDLLAIEAIMWESAKDNWFAKSAIEMACWDIQGKVADKPVYELLGGAIRPLGIRCRFSMGAYDTEHASRCAAELVEAGFTTIKVKVGADRQADVERVRAVREAIGVERDLVIDANAALGAESAIQLIEKLEDCNVGLFEQPTPRGDFEGLAHVRQRINPPVMADDICFDMSDARECVRNDACDVISVYPGKNGGIRRSKEIVEFAAGHEVACSIGSNLELDVASAAMCHLVVACPNMQVETFPGDILGPDYHEFSIAKNPLSIQGPVISITDSPGLGIGVDWELVKQHRAD
jgi:L-alanine-DL-glutamate epimerase-like enolase superfamily enzyme